jgi:hypothetical protein
VYFGLYFGSAFLVGSVGLSERFRGRFGGPSPPVGLALPFAPVALALSESRLLLVPSSLVRPIRFLRW